MWTPIDGRLLTIDQFKGHVAVMTFTDFRPSCIVVHNTANPALNPLKDHGSWYGSKTSPHDRVNVSLVSFYRDTQKWNAGPHFFVDADGVWLFTPMNKRGTHSPSWNGISFGMEMVGDYDVEDFNSDGGAKVHANAVAVLAVICAKMGWDPLAAGKVRFHYEDPATTHACPGKNVSKPTLLREVLEYMSEGGGEHTVNDETQIVKAPLRTGVVNADGLNVRKLSSASAPVIMALKKGANVAIEGDVLNGSTKWFQISQPVQGWVSARYIDV